MRLLLFWSNCWELFFVTYFLRFLLISCDSICWLLGFPIVLRHESSLSLTLSIHRRLQFQTLHFSKVSNFTPSLYMYVFLFIAFCDNFMELESFCLVAEKTEEKKRKYNCVLSFVFDVSFRFGLVELASVSSFVFLLLKSKEYLKSEM